MIYPMHFISLFIPYLKDCVSLAQRKNRVQRSSINLNKNETISHPKYLETRSDFAFGIFGSN